MSASRYRPIVALMMSSFILLTVAPVLAQKPRVSVSDIVQMTSLFEPALSAQAEYPPTVSPDGAWFFIVTRRGDLSIDRNVYDLILYSSTEVLNFVNAPPAGAAALPRGKVLATFKSRGRGIIIDGGIRGARWVDDGKTIAFIGEGQDGDEQVYAVDAVTATLTHLTSVDEPVINFDYDTSSGVVLYLTRLPCATPECTPDDSTRSSFVVGTRTINQTLFPERYALWQPIYQFSMVRAREPAKRVHIGAPFAGMMPEHMWIAPGGHKAISQRGVDDPARLKVWRAYAGKGMQLLLDSSAAGRTDDIFMGPGWNHLKEFVLLDLDSGVIRSMFNAPDGLAANTGVYGGTFDVHWTAAADQAIVANTYLSLDVPDARERLRRSKAPAIVGYSVKSGVASWITDVSDGLLRMRVVGDDHLSLLRPAGKRDCYRRAGSRWSAMACGRAPLRESPLLLSLHQDMNTAPDILAEDSRTGRNALITRLNPNLDSLARGTVTTVELTDVQGKHWTGGLLYPPGAARDARYPVVIQSGGFNPGEFLIDGPFRHPSAYAAQALASRGIVVLQLPHPPFPVEDRASVLDFRRFIESAIGLLCGTGVADPDRIGIMGFSREGMRVTDMLAFSDRPIAAAVLSDNRNLGLFSSVASVFGYRPPSMLTSEDLMGSRPWGSGVSTWVERDAAFHVDHFQAAVRFENYGLYVPASWDLYALMRRQHKPAEMVIYPNAIHLLWNPRQRFESLEGNVDWLDFWLTGHEDANPAKLAQYSRWQALRALRKQNN